MPSKTYMGDNPDGSPNFHFDFSDLDITTHGVVLTGPINGVISVPSGNSYNVNPFAIPVLLGDIEPLQTAITQAHVDAWTFGPDFVPGDPNVAITPVEVAAPDVPPADPAAPTA